MTISSMIMRQKDRRSLDSIYVSLLGQLNAKIKENRSHSKKKVIFVQDNAPVCPCTVLTAKIEELKSELIDQSAFSRYLAPSEIFLFSNLKKWLSRIKFNWNCIN